MDFPTHSVSEEDSVNTTKEKFPKGINAVYRLYRYGKAAFPYLIEYLDDGRPSNTALKAKLPITVAGTCIDIIEGMIFNLPDDYPITFGRMGSDGKNHRRPLTTGPELFNSRTIEAWLEERNDKRLIDLQIEALQWLIEQEKEISFATEEDKEKYLYPLENHLVLLEKKASKETKD